MSKFLNNIVGKIINHNDTFYGKIDFNNYIKEIKKTENKNNNNIIIPGFVDLHCHGGDGFDTMQGIDSIVQMSKYHLKNGTTSLLPTTLTATLKDTYKALYGINNFLEKSANESNIEGIHLEGPFINPKKLGAQPPFAQIPNIDFVKEIMSISKVKIVTLAPELENSNKLIDWLLKENINVQFGHSLADYECCMKIMTKNKIGFTHLYNAMSGNDHRNPGVLTAALRHAQYAEIICDLNHVHKESIHLAAKCIPYIYAISDAIAACGMPNGRYNFSNLKVHKKDNRAFINNNTLAGSVVNMHDTFRNLIDINFSLQKAVAMTSYNPSRYIGETNKGKIDIGYCSNFLVLDKELNIKEVYLNGQLI